MEADYLSINKELNEVNWDAVLCDESIDTNWESFKNILLTVSTKFTPKTVKKPYSNKPSWWTTQISKVVKEKHQLYSQ